MKRWLLILGLACSLNLLADATHQRTEQRYQDDTLIINPQFELVISEKVREAINNGIVITFVIQAKLFKQVDWWFDQEMGNKINTYQLRYFSLSRQYQLIHRGSAEKLSFVTLEQLLDHMSSRSEFRFQEFSEATHSETRLFLDKQALPSTMQLPTVFDQDWNINSGWQSVPVTPRTGELP